MAAGKEQEGVKLALLLKGEKEAMEELRTALEKNGWALVVVPEDVLELVDKALEAAKPLFGPKPTVRRRGRMLRRREFEPPKAYRMVTGETSLKKFESAGTPKEFVDLARASDKLSRSLLEALMDVFLPPRKDAAKFSLAEAFRALDIPLAREEEQKRHGVLDVVQHASAGAAKPNKSPNIVAPHEDRGLFTISYLSDGPGLEMKEGDGKWAPVAERQAVLWCGSAAATLSNRRIPAAVHRVATNSNEQERDRQTWGLSYEVCRGVLAHQVFETFTVSLRTLTGKVEIIPDVTPNMTGCELKAHIYAKLGSLAQQMRLRFQGIVIEDEDNIHSLGITLDSKLHMFMYLGGER